MIQNIKKLGYFLLFTFVTLILYLTYLVMVEGDTLATHPQNRRIAVKEAGIIRGTIYDRVGTKLAETKWLGQRGERVYLKEGKDTPFAHITGYVSDRYGSFGLEASYSKELLGLTEADVLENVLDKILNRTPQGNDLVLTLDAVLQRTALKALAGRRGAVVALNPRTGEILALASSPTFDANKIDQPGVWQQLNQDAENAPLLNRATQGAYPPGSVIKVVTGAGILSQNILQPQATVQCPGYAVIDGQRIKDNKAHGSVDFIKAIALSCNAYFALEGSKLGWGKFEEVFNQFGLNEKPEIGIPVRPGTIAQKDRRNQSQLAESAFGQGDTLLSPLHMALACSAVANRGIIMKPFLVKEIRKPDGSPVKITESTPWLTATTPQVAEQIAQGMTAAVNWGTASSASIRGIEVAGKTGTAEIQSATETAVLPHAWFIGYAPAKDPQIAVAVIVEKSGAGGRIAAPVAREVMAVALMRDER
ncbi:cell elongation-specific peptidoglycan D,D-transpeptidase [Desulforamulus reducens MI-1]|uniref:Cell elongation-specific peptidoglycan D,D-transpeptidase n=1 Tax=Desulforamulus reducens (strain ATCC BAA-1160 / DSM 100696 / MI-1) TaxID=349161 RepID=A4J587_DESRM|nr:penicillin-binding transpeptidase domain-containing protein [Desulforamulus reducens]ABO50240.1 cell elongation-specific peptidoglycan D,D-transpeptidase [Desulforamulus reducens MI-1]